MSERDEDSAGSSLKPWQSRAWYLYDNRSVVLFCFTVASRVKSSLPISRLADRMLILLGSSILRRAIDIHPLTFAFDSDYYSSKVF
jgi:hypothetical protein